MWVDKSHDFKIYNMYVCATVYSRDTSLQVCILYVEIHFNTRSIKNNYDVILLKTILMIKKRKTGKYISDIQTIDCYLFESQLTLFSGQVSFFHTFTANKRTFIFYTFITLAWLWLYKYLYAHKMYLQFTINHSYKMCFFITRYTYRS